MLKILAISGSTKTASTNLRLLQAMDIHFSKLEFSFFDLASLPSFHPDQRDQVDDAVLQFRTAIDAADALIISTPEYLHNIPAVLKNALEWITSSGELHEKRVLPISYTPVLPRGEKAMQSLLWSLDALKAQIVVSLALDQQLVQVDENGLSGEGVDMLETAVGMLVE